MKNFIDAVPYILFALVVGGVFFGPTIINWLKQRKYTNELKKYAALTEPIFVFSLHPGDQTVRKRANAHRQLLLESGNKWDIQVYEYYFQEAGHVTENWKKFEARVDADAAMKLNSWSFRVKSANREIYLTEILRQQ